ncbi:MAG: glycosyltransferase family 4 protein [Clostridium sp.]|nr:glycosyltransferase family 4 protein [Clostridium sp.]
MKVLVVSQFFWPEEFRINDICKGLKNEGHEVEIITGLPNYPMGKFFKGYSVKGPYKEEFEGMKVMRFPVIPRGKSGALNMILNYLSFMINGSFRIIPILFKRYDRVFMFQSSPITAAIPAIIYSRVKKVPSYIYIQDLWPETFYSIVPINNERLKKIFKRLCTRIYNRFSTILISSKGYENILTDSGIDKSKIVYFPQWAEDLYSKEIDEVIEKDKNKLVLTFAGNIGKAQSVETIIKAANLAKDRKSIQWNILGNGSEFDNIKSMVDEYGLSDTVHLLGRKPVEEMPRYFKQSDGLIVTLKDEGILRVTLPAKVQSYMAAGRPIIAAISGEGAAVIEEARCGIACEAEDYETLYKNVLKFYEMKTLDREQLGLNGKRYFQENFTREKLLGELNSIMT